MMKMTAEQTHVLEGFVAKGQKFLEPPSSPWGAFFSRARQRNGVALAPLGATAC